MVQENLATVTFISSEMNSFQLTKATVAKCPLPLKFCNVNGFESSTDCYYKRIQYRSVYKGLLQTSATKERAIVCVTQHLYLHWLCVVCCSTPPLSAVP